MTAATILRYFRRSEATSVRPKLLVCGPTNKSVVVLARKVLNCLGDSNSLKLALVGDTDELLADRPDEIEGLLVRSYLPQMLLKWKEVLKIHWSNPKLLHSDYERDTTNLLSQMKMRLKETDFRDVEECLDDVRSAVKEMKSASKKEKKSSGEKYRKAIKAVTDSVKNLSDDQVVRDLLDSADVVFCTLIAAGSMPIIRMKNVSALIVDEASACTEPEILIALRKKPDRMLLVGDPKQLPAFVASPFAVECGLSRSLQDRLMFKHKFDYTLLNEQYRMRPEISKWPVKHFYKENVADGVNVLQSTYRTSVSLLDGDPYCWIQVSAEEKKDKSLSTFNEGEAEAVIAILFDMKQKYRLKNNWFSSDRIRVITFYQAQVNFIRDLLGKYGMEDVMVSTVDASQGCEADVVVVSFVRGSSGYVGFLKDRRRLNVALTRAKFQLVCVGNLGALSSLDDVGGHSTLGDMAKDAKSRARVYNHRSPLPPPPVLPKKVCDGSKTPSYRKVTIKGGGLRKTK